jgi:hypothetical protein
MSGQRYLSLNPEYNEASVLPYATDSGDGTNQTKDI